MRLPFVAVGLLYRQGYFAQTIDSHGNQRATYVESDFDDLPIVPVQRDDGTELKIAVEFPGREVMAKVWRAQVGCVNLYLLDTDIEENSAHDRYIAHQLYGGDRTTRIEQEIVLGVGGVRALGALGLNPTLWHINEARRPGGRTADRRIEQRVPYRAHYPAQGRHAAGGCRCDRVCVAQPARL